MDSNLGYRTRFDSSSRADNAIKAGASSLTSIWCEASAGPSYLTEKWTVALMALVYCQDVQSASGHALGIAR
jgi:hypothetical protein